MTHDSAGRQCAKALLFRWLIAAACMLALPAGGCGRPQQYVPAGDELYDRFAGLVLEQSREKGWHLQVQPEGGFWEPWSWMHEPETMDFGVIAQWEQDFADDPRYWELRTVCGIDEVRTSRLVDGEWVGGYHGMLRRKVDAGVCSAAGFRLLKLERMLALDEEEDAALGYMQQAIDCDPGNSYWYYKLAEARMYLGEADLAWEAVRSGNSAPRNELPLPFPFSTLRDERYGADTVENLAVSGVVYELEMLYVPNFIITKDHYKEQAVCTALGYPLEAADDWLTMARRYGQFEGAQPVQSLIGAAYAHVLLDYITTECLDVPEDCSGELEAMLGLNDTWIEQSKTVFDQDGSTLVPGCKPTWYSKVMAKYRKLDTMIQMHGPPPDMEEARATVMPDRTRQDWVNLGIISAYELRQAPEFARQLDILDPPPFVRWATAGTR